MIPAMKASVSIQVRVPHEQARLIKRAARLANEKPATWVRRVAILAAEQAVESAAYVAVTAPEVVRQP